MAGGYPVPFTHSSAVSGGFVGTDVKGTLVTSGAANTKGAWTTIVASTASDIAYLRVALNGLASLANRAIAFDVAAAPAASEASGLVMQNVVYDVNAGYSWDRTIPCGMIAAGSRIAFRFASGTASDSALVSVTGMDTGWLSGGSAAGVDTYGYTSGAIQGLAVDPGGTAGTKGAYVQFTASATNDYCGFFLGFDGLNNLTPAAGDATCVMDVALGGSGSESVIVPNIQLVRNNFGTGYVMGPSVTDIFYTPIAAGTRVTIRAACISNTAVVRVPGVSFYGVRR